MAQPLDEFSGNGEGHAARSRRAACHRFAGLPNIIYNQVQDFFAAVCLGQKVLSECCCSDFGEAFVLGDREHLLFGQAA